MALPPDVVPLVRGFANNSFRYLFRQAGNVADLLRWCKPRLARHIDFSGLVVQPETFIAPSFSEMESDILLRAPWRADQAGPAGIQVYLLIEHQSEPDEHSTFRALRYTIGVYDRQEKIWLAARSNTRGLRFDPVLPVVFYSGTRTWTELEAMAQLVHHGEQFGALIPSLKPVFINLATLTPAILQRRVGVFGWVLWLIQQKRQREAGFRDVLRQVVERVDRLHARERGRWEHLLWFAHALVYHVREEPERQQFADFIRASVRQAEQPQVQDMGKTIAEALREEGMLEGKAEGVREGALAKQRETLLRQLRVKFKRVSPAIVAMIEACQDGQQLDAWLDAFATAEKLSDIPFPKAGS